jgi:hypothetical protein
VSRKEWDEKETSQFPLLYRRKGGLEGKYDALQCNRMRHCSEAELLVRSTGTLPAPSTLRWRALVCSHIASQLHKLATS